VATDPDAKGRGKVVVITGATAGIGHALTLDHTALGVPSTQLAQFADQLRTIARGQQTDALVRLLATTS